MSCCSQTVDSSKICKGFYITNDNEKVSANFIIDPDINGFLNLQHRIIISLDNGTIKEFKPGEIKLFQIDRLKFTSQVYDITYTFPYDSIPKLFNNCKFQTVPTGTNGDEKIFMFCYKETSYINELYGIGKSKYGVLMIGVKYFLNNSTQKLYSSQNMWHSNKNLLDFFCDYPLLVQLIKNRDLQRKGDVGLILSEYIKWKTKQDCLLKNDTFNSIFSEYLGIHNDTSYVLKALVDADKNYKPKGAFLSALGVTTFLTPLGGFPYAVVVGLKKSKDKNLRFPNSNLKSNEAYYNAYKKRAEQIKLDRLVKGFMLGIVTCIVFYGLIQGFK